MQWAFILIVRAGLIEAIFVHVWVEDLTKVSIDECFFETTSKVLLGLDYRCSPLEGLLFRRLLCVRYGYCCFVYSEMECVCHVYSTRGHRVHVYTNKTNVNMPPLPLMWYNWADFNRVSTIPIRVNVQQFTAASDLRQLRKTFFVWRCSLLGKFATVSATLCKSN